MAVRPSTVGIFNLALSYLGGEQLSSVQAPWEDSTLGRQCLNLWPQILDEALSAHPWSFAKAVDVLAEKQSGGAGVRYCHRYSLPAGCLRPIDLVSGHDYILMGQDLFTDDGLAELIYIRRVEDPAMFPPSFRNALAYAMAAVLAAAKQNDQRLRQDCVRMSQTFLMEAAAQDNNIQKPRERVTSWELSRRGVRGITWRA